jgi:hypothetical protein
VLDLADRLHGALPFDLDLAIDLGAFTHAAAAAAAAATSATAATSVKPTGLAVAEAAASATAASTSSLGPDRCFALLSRALRTESLNYWSLWAFVNGLFFNLKVRQSGIQSDPLHREHRQVHHRTLHLALRTKIFLPVPF